jgi:hypothetical protein
MTEEAAGWEEIEAANANAGRSGALSGACKAEAPTKRVWVLAEAALDAAVKTFWPASPDEGPGHVCCMCAAVPPKVKAGKAGSAGAGLSVPDAAGDFAAGLPAGCSEA